MPTFTHDRVHFHYLDSGTGLPFIFQHGLGGYAHLAHSLFKPPPGFRLLSVDARGHGRTHPVGDAASFTFDGFAGDLLALMDHLRIRQAILGGISMGAGVALNAALRFPERALGLVLSRPAGLDAPQPWNVRMFTLVSRLLREHGAQRGQGLFKETDEYRETLRQWPDAANSLALQFTGPRAAETAFKLEALSREAPCRDLRECARIQVPTLVLANHLDPVHPFEVAEELARCIPGAELKEITSKSVSVVQHGRDVQKHVQEFLKKHFDGLAAAARGAVEGDPKAAGHGSGPGVKWTR
jgi:pimeloyl-ACP methyl ester carboxylesterase